MCVCVCVFVFVSEIRNSARRRPSSASKEKQVLQQKAKLRTGKPLARTRAAAVQAAARPGGTPPCGALRLHATAPRHRGSVGVAQGRHLATMPSRRQERRRRQTADRVHPTRAAAVPWRERHPAAQVRLPRKAGRGGTRQRCDRGHGSSRPCSAEGACGSMRRR